MHAWVCVLGCREQMAGMLLIILEHSGTPDPNRELRGSKCQSPRHSRHTERGSFPPPPTPTPATKSSSWIMECKL